MNHFVPSENNRCELLVHKHQIKGATRPSWGWLEERNLRYIEVSAAISCSPEITVRFVFQQRGGVGVCRCASWTIFKVALCHLERVSSPLPPLAAFFLLSLLHDGEAKSSEGLAADTHSPPPAGACVCVCMLYHQNTHIYCTNTQAGK